MSDLDKTLVYYYDEDGRRLAIAEVDQLPVVGDVVTFREGLWEGFTGSVLNVSSGHISDSGYPVTRIDMGGTRTTLD